MFEIGLGRVDFRILMFRISGFFFSVIGVR